MDGDTGEHQQDGIDAPAQMRQAREAAGLALTEVASRTRVPVRHLEALERGDYGALPGVTYCAGFARAYARAVGLDEKALAAKVRQEVEATGDFADPYQMEEPVDPARVPPRLLAWTAAVIALLVIGGYALWRMQVNSVPDGTGDVTAAEQRTVAPRAAPAAARAPAPATGPVVLTAAEDVWLRIYERGGRPILERIVRKGESFTVPADARAPLILTGRPDAIAFTVGGRSIPPLGTAERTIADVPVDAASLLARLDDAPASASAPVPTGTPAAGPSASPGTRPADRPSPRRTTPRATSTPADPAPPPAASGPTGAAPAGAAPTAPAPAAPAAPAQPPA